MPRLHTRREAGTLVFGAAASIGAAVLLDGSAVARAGETIRVDARPEPFLLDPKGTAVLVIDMQNDFGSKGGMFDRAGIPIDGIRAVIPAVQLALASAPGGGLADRLPQDGL